MEKIKKRRKNSFAFWNSEKLLSISAILVSIGTFIILTVPKNYL